MTDTQKKNVAKILGVEYAVVQAPMAYIAGYRLAAAVSSAGGLGVLGPNAGYVEGEQITTRDRLLRELHRVRELTDKPVGVNVVLAAGGNAAALAYAKSTVLAAADGGATACVCVGGLVPEIFDLIKEKGMNLIVRPLTPDSRNARRAEELGADIFVATGCDAGGVLPANGVGTFSIVPAIASSLSIPVLAAGGINDRRGVRAALALGAAGVFCGTRFIATEECAANLKTKELICKCRGADLLVIDDTKRSLPTEFAAEVYVKHRLQPGAPASVDLVHALRDGMYGDNPDKGIVSVNTAIDLIASVVPAAQALQELAAGFEAA